MCSLKWGWPTRAISAFACSHVFRKSVSAGAERFEAEVDPHLAEGRHDSGKELGGEVECLVVRHAEQQAALLRRAQHHQRTAEVVSRLGETTR